MNLGIENIHLNREDWPEVLSPDQRQQLLLGKLARAQQAVEQRKKYSHRQLLTELENSLRHEQSQR
jgi:hypothetical protein